MDLTVFQSDKGDCLLLTSKNKHRVLIDGGMASSYSEFVAPAMGALQKAGQTLDVVYVSHIDSDHISGVLRMVDDLVDWRVHNFQREQGNRAHTAPESHRPPDVKAIWHNAFHEQIGKNAGRVEDMLAASAAILSGHESPRIKEVAQAQRNLVTSEREAIRLSRRVGPAQLGIPLNTPAGGKLMMVREGQSPIAVGALRFHTIGPAPADLRKLRSEWDDWLRENEEALAKIRAQSRRDEERLGTGEIASLVAPLVAQAEQFGNRKKVTAPNLASLMFYVEEQGSDASLLLTGDGHADDVLDGLRKAGKLNGGGLHLTALKVQHHGAEFNMTREFAKAVTADHYIICGNGAHHNPDPMTLEAIVDSRLGEAKHRSSNPRAGRPFKIWCNSSPDQPHGNETNKQHMRAVRDDLRKRATRSGGKLKLFFLKGASFELPLG
jgi:beta-lactamase superfamily II metal-dependent hydrolase